MLKHGKPEEIQNMFSSLGRDTKHLVTQTTHMVYFMRGAVTYREAMAMCPAERSVITDFLEHRLEEERNKMNPVY